MTLIRPTPELRPRQSTLLTQTLFSTFSSDVKRFVFHTSVLTIVCIYLHHSLCNFFAIHYVKRNTTLSPRTSLP